MKVDGDVHDRDVKRAWLRVGTSLVHAEQPVDTVATGVLGGGFDGGGIDIDGDHGGADSCSGNRQDARPAPHIEHPLARSNRLIDEFERKARGGVRAAAEGMARIYLDRDCVGRRREPRRVNGEPSASFDLQKIARLVEPNLIGVDLGCVRSRNSRGSCVGVGLCRESGPNGAGKILDTDGTEAPQLRASNLSLVLGDGNGDEVVAQTNTLGRPSPCISHSAM